MHMTRTFFVRAIALLLLTCSNFTFGQAIIQVRVVSVQTLNNRDCDGFLLGDSDFVWEFTATDNTLGYTNNNPALFGIYDFNYAFVNGNNGPYTVTSPNGAFVPNNGIFFDHQYICPTDVPTNINLAWEAYENDDAFNYSNVGLTDGETGIQNVTMAVPAGAGVLNYVFNANSTDVGCTQSYRITLEVSRTIFAPAAIILADDICDAPLFAVNTTYSGALCLSNSLEPNEPRGGDVAAHSSSAWFRFVAPASGEVEISTDLGGTEFGTYIEIYHAADGSSCNTGIQPITGTLLKDKFEYLSHIEFSDGIDLLGVDPEAQISLDACDPVPLVSYQKLIAGETYYVQVTGDDANDAGIVEIRVSDLGGGPSGDTEDIPCLSTPVATGTGVISSELGSPETALLDFGCAYDGGNDFAETGAPHTNNDPNNYHAYDYDHVASNNSVVNESVWLNFTAPNNGRMVFEADYESALYGENNALFGYDVRFAPGIPTDYSCANLEFISQDEGGTNSILGGDPSALITAQCLEPGYKYFGMIDPSNNVTLFNSQQISAWLYDPSVVDPSSNPPGNDILCLTMGDPLYEIPVTPAGTNPNFQAVAGDNVFACREYLAGEPAADPNAANRADQTVWHYFVAPPSGAVEMNIRAYIGLNQLRYNVYQLLNGTDCYGGLNPATYTEDGTRNTPIITPVLSGVAGFTGTQESLCCLVPGTIYAVQLDGGSPGDEGQYIIEYIKEVASDAGDIYVELDNGSIIEVTQPDTAFVCFGETITPGIMLNGIGQTTLDIPSCLQLGYVIHNIDPIPDPVANTGFTFIDSVQTATGTFVNDTDGSGTFGNPLFNQVYFVSPMADEPANWGDLTCVSSTVEEGVPVVFLQPVVPSSSYNSALCEITFSAAGGLAAFNSSTFSYTIQNAAMNTVAVGTFANGGTVVYPVPSAEVYTITVTDGACPYTFTIDASACSNPCLTNPNINFVNATICNGETIFLEGANQTTAGLYTDVFTATNGCDSTIYTTVTVIEPVVFAQTFTICQGSSVTVGTNTYNTSGIYTDVLTAANGCDSTITTTLFVESVLTSNYSMTICDGDSYVFEGSTLTTSGTYNSTLTAVGGCDSIVTLFLTVRPPNGSMINASICQGQTYTFGSSTYSTGGTYTNVLTDANGCDSTVTLNLTVNPALTGSMAATICSGQDYIFGTQTLSTSGTYTEPFTTVAGCDSIVTLYLTILPALSSSQSATICQGQSYTFGTQTLTISGTYTETVQTVTGCDSTSTLYLFVTEPTEFYTDSTICEGSTMVFGTQTLTTSGIYTEQFTTAGGCDSLVYLELSVTDCAADFEISNIVTPNDDGQNDTWKISDPTQVAGCTVTIYNRWGQPVFESTEYQNEWGGTKDGEPLPDGVYFYSIKCSDTEYTGEVNLFRFKK